MNFLDTNPFRVLGINVTSSEKEIVKSVSTLTTYLEMGKEKKFTTDFPFLCPITRKSELIIESSKLIEQAENKFQQSLFWYWINNTTDELVIELLNENDISKSIEILEKSTFTNKQQSSKLEVLTNNFILDISNWGGDGNSENHTFKKVNNEFIIDRKLENDSFCVASEALNFDSEKDWVIESDLRWISGSSESAFGIIFGRNKAGSFYTFCISSDGSYMYAKFEDWAYEERIVWTSANCIRNNSSNNIAIKKVGKDLNFYINGNKVNSYLAEPFFGNDFGFRVFKNQKVSFSNFKFLTSIVDNTYGSGINATSRNISCIKNLSVLFLHLTFLENLNLPILEKKINKDFFKKCVALSYYFLYSPLIDEYSKKVSGEKFKFSTFELVEFYVIKLFDLIKPYINKENDLTEFEFISFFIDFPDDIKSILINKFISKNIQNIEEEVELSKKLRKENQTNATQYGKNLKKNTILDLVYIKNILGIENLRYINLADKIANEIIQCGIDSFNTFKTPDGEIDYILAIPSEEGYLEDYEFAKTIAGSLSVKEKAIENLDSCKKVIENKDYYNCWFCKKNPPEKSCVVNTVIYKETERSYFPRSVKYSYLELKVPRCSHCQKIHVKHANRSAFIFIGFIVLGIIIGLIIPDWNWFGGGIGGVVAAYILTELIGFKDWDSKPKNGVLEFRDASLFPEVRKYIYLGWSTSKPTA